MLSFCWPIFMDLYCRISVAALSGISFKTPWENKIKCSFKWQWIFYQYSLRVNHNDVVYPSVWSWEPFLSGRKMPQGLCQNNRPVYYYGQVCLGWEEVTTVINKNVLNPPHFFLPQRVWSGKKCDCFSLFYFFSVIWNPKGIYRALFFFLKHNKALTIAQY